MEVTIDSLFARIGRLTVEGDELRSQLAAAEGTSADLRAEVESLRAALVATGGELEAAKAEAESFRRAERLWEELVDKRQAEIAALKARVAEWERRPTWAHDVLDSPSEPPAPGPVTHLADFHPADLAGTHV